MHPLTSSRARRFTGALLAVGLAATAVTLPLSSASAAPGDISTLAGTVPAGFAGDGGPATAAKLNGNQASAYDAAGNLFIADRSNNRVRRITPSGTISTYMGDGTAASGGDGGPAAAAQVNAPEGLAIDPSGNLYVGEALGHRVRKVTPAGLVSTYVGTGVAGNAGNGGLATAATIDSPSGLAFDPAGNLYVADPGSSVVRRVDAATNVITPTAGTGTSGFSGDGGPAVTAQLNAPRAVAVINSLIFIADSANNRIRVVLLGGSIITVAGTGTPGFSGDGGNADLAQLNHPVGLVSTGLQLFVADTGNNRMRRIEDGKIFTVAGTTNGYSGDGGPATAAQLSAPMYPVENPAGNLVWSDNGTGVMRQLQLAALPAATTTTTSTTSTTLATTSTTTPPAITPATPAVPVRGRPAFTG